MIYKDGLPDLRYAARNETAAELRRYLDACADAWSQARFWGRYVDSQDRSGVTALMAASALGRTEIVQLLLEEGADVNAKMYDEEWTVLMSACQGQTGPGIYREDCLAQARSAVVRMLIAKGAEVNARSKFGWTALMWAGNREIAELLLAHGATVNAKTNDGRSVLYMASENGRRDVVEVLLAHGADVSISRSDGSTALSAATAKGHSDIRALLLRAGATAPFPKSLSEAAKGRDLDAVKTMLANGADVNAKGGTSGFTALIQASRNHDAEMVRILLANGAEVNAKDWLGRTALDFALFDEDSSARTAVVRTLLASGAVVDREVVRNSRKSKGVRGMLWRAYWKQRWWPF